MDTHTRIANVVVSLGNCKLEFFGSFSELVSYSFSAITMQEIFGEAWEMKVMRATMFFSLALIFKRKLRVLAFCCCCHCEHAEEVLASCYMWIIVACFKTWVGERNELTGRLHHPGSTGSTPLVKLTEQISLTQRVPENIVLRTKRYNSHSQKWNTFHFFLANWSFFLTIPVY